MIIAEELAERNFGDFEGKDNNGDYYGLWQHDNAHTPNGETPVDLEVRVFPFLDRIRKQYRGKNILLVAHGGIGLTIETYYKGVPDDKNLLQYVAGNGELKIYDIEND